MLISREKWVFFNVGALKADSQGNLRRMRYETKEIAEVYIHLEQCPETKQ